MRWIRRFAVKVIRESCLEALQRYAAEHKRLEIKVLELQTELEAVAASHHKLLKRSVGRLSNQGRPPQADSEPTSLDGIATGDKAALRRHFAGEIASRGPRANQR